LCGATSCGNTKAAHRCAAFVVTARFQRMAMSRMMPRNFITADGFHITERARRYLQPLIRGEDYPPFRDGLPVYVKLKNVAVPKKLKSGFKL
jgi:hypothetical protein